MPSPWAYRIDNLTLDNTASLYGGAVTYLPAPISVLHLVKSGPPPPDRTDTHTAGDLVQDDNGALWFCTADGTPGTWWLLTGTPPGVLVPLVAPVRVYDSRPGGNADGPLAGGKQRVVSLAGTSAKPAVPAGAVGALLSLTLDATAGSGFLSVFANGIAWPGTSNANWYTNGQILAVTTTTYVDANATVIVLAGGPGSTQFVIDVIGYYP
jgi:hypothetical protein